MTWREYVLIVRGFAIKRSHDFEHTRAIVYNTLAMNRAPAKRFPSIEEVWPLLTDDNEANQAYEDREEKRLLAIIEAAKKRDIK